MSHVKLKERSDSTSSSRVLRICDLVDIVTGKTKDSTSFRMSRATLFPDTSSSGRSTSSENRDTCVFTIVGKERYLCLEAKDTIEFDQLLNGFHLLVQTST